MGPHTKLAEMLWGPSMRPGAWGDQRQIPWLCSCIHPAMEENRSCCSS